jgi:hypothetical protein
LNLYIDVVAAKGECAHSEGLRWSWGTATQFNTKALGGPDIGMIPETDYDNLFTIIWDASGVRPVRSRY